MVVTTYIMRANGITVTFDDDTVAEGEFFSGPNGFELIGLTQAQKNAVYTYLNNGLWDKLIDPRLRDDSAGGLPGPPGPNGDSAYQVAVNNGFVGTEPQWLLTLVGPPGPPGPPGVISGSPTPIFLDNSNPVGAQGQINVKVVGGYAYVTSVSNSGLGIFDVSNPNNITFLSSINGNGAPNFLGTPIDVEIVGNLAYVTSFTNDAVTVIDISNKTSPVHLYSLVDTIRLDGAQQLKVRGRYCYVAVENASRIAIIDIFDGIRILTSVSHPFMIQPRGLEIVGDLLFVASRNGQSLLIFDISVPDNPTLAGSLVSPSLAQASDVKVKNGVAFVSCLSIGSNRVVAVNVATPSAPVIIGTLFGGLTQNNPIQTSIAGNVLYVLSVNDSAITLVDISDTTLFGNGQIMGYLSDPVNMNAVQGIFVDGTTAYTASFGSGLSTFRVMGFVSSGADLGNANATTINVEQYVNVGRDVRAVGVVSAVAGLKSEQDVIANRELKGRYLYQDVSFSQPGQFAACGNPAQPIVGSGICGFIDTLSDTNFVGVRNEGCFAGLFTNSQYAGMSTGNVLNNLTNSRMLLKFTITDFNNLRFFAGLSTGGIINTIDSDAPIVNMVGISFSPITNSDPDLQFIYKKGSITSRVSSGITLNGGEVYYLEIESPIGFDSWLIKLYNSDLQLLLEHEATTSIPDTLSDALSVVCAIENFAGTNEVVIFNGFAVNRFN